LDNVHRGPLAVAVVMAATVVLSSPLMPRIVSAVASARPAQFQAIVGSAIAAAVAIALIVALVRIRDRRARRFGGLAASVAVAVLYARAVATGNAQVDAVERAHFVEYGLIAFLFYRAWRPLDNGAAVARAFLAAVFAGTADEFVQWFVPSRVGEAHDVFINAVAASCGLLFAVSVDPPAHFAEPLSRREVRRTGRALSIVLLTFALFFRFVHLGYQIYDPDIGMFWSEYSAPDLAAIGRDRAARWRTSPPGTLRLFAREDHYLSEGLWHVQARNMAWTAGDPFSAWRENRILETFFAPVLDTPSYASRAPARWPPEQRDDTAARVAGDPGIYISRAAPYPIYTWPPIAFWTVVAVIITAVLTAC